MVGKALTGELSCPCDRSCISVHSYLARLYECRGRAVAPLLASSLVLFATAALMLELALSKYGSFTLKFFYAMDKLSDKLSCTKLLCVHKSSHVFHEVNATDFFLQRIQI